MLMALSNGVRKRQQKIPPQDVVLRILNVGPCHRPVDTLILIQQVDN